MKKQTITIIIIAVIILAVILGAILIINKNKGDEGGKIETVGQMKEMFKTIYSKLGEELPNLETQEISVEDETQVKAYTGLKSNKNIEKIVASEPLMSSQAYSAVTVKVKSGANIEEIKKEMLENINMSKWICVSAEKMYITNNGNTIFMVMSSEDWAKPVYNEFKEYVGNNIGKELEKAEEENINLPPQMIVQ